MTMKRGIFRFTQGVLQRMMSDSIQIYPGDDESKVNLLLVFIIREFGVMASVTLVSVCSCGQRERRRRTCECCVTV